MATGTVVVLLLIAALSAAAAAAAAAMEDDASLAAPAAAGFYVFGDSTVDVGNNNLLPGVAPKANFPPYGIDYPGGGIPTGRFSNGFIGVDYIAKGLGYTTSPPPFVSVANVMQMIQGVSFASGGSGILDTTGTDVITMDEQIKNFEVVKEKMTAVMGKALVEAFLARSIFFISTANNDLFAGFFINNSRNDEEKEEIIIPIINKFKHQLSMLYDLGARKFAVAGTGLIGCIPAMRLFDPSADCNKDLNDLSMRFKNATKALLEELSSTLAGFRYSLGSAYEVGSRINDQPHLFGLKELKAACCGSGRLNAEYPCSANATVCPDHTQYYFWDMIHPTQAAYSHIGEMFLRGSPQFSSPVNIQQLVFDDSSVNA